MNKFLAVLSTTILVLDGAYSIRTVSGEERQKLLEEGLRGVPSYIGHPDTKTLVEALGAVPAPTKLFAGLQIGESAICMPIKQGLSTRSEQGFTAHQAISDLGTLEVRLLTRVA